MKVVEHESWLDDQGDEHEEIDDSDHGGSSASVESLSNRMLAVSVSDDAQSGGWYTEDDEIHDDDIVTDDQDDHWEDVDENSGHEDEMRDSQDMEDENDDDDEDGDEDEDDDDEDDDEDYTARYNLGLSILNGMGPQPLCPIHDLQARTAHLLNPDHSQHRLAMFLDRLDALGSTAETNPFYFEDDDDDDDDEEDDEEDENDDEDDHDEDDDDDEDDDAHNHFPSDRLHPLHFLHQRRHHNEIIADVNDDVEDAHNGYSDDHEDDEDEDDDDDDDDLTDYDEYNDMYDDYDDEYDDDYEDFLDMLDDYQDDPFSPSSDVIATTFLSSRAEEDENYLGTVLEVVHRMDESGAFEHHPDFLDGNIFYEEEIVTRRVHFRTLHLRFRHIYSFQDAPRRRRPEPRLENLLVRTLNACDQLVETSIDCIICQETYVAGKTIAKMPCGHEYHDDCIRHWLNHNDTCPVCRQSLNIAVPAA
ncbi:hypothetical protein BC940DRAFT_175426 [Gongronella butleri]|nr:hypothetical protein BC940DRAFT_175426 [Gongronella butleri]